jgi:hypothetical protein
VTRVIQSLGLQPALAGFIGSDLLVRLFLGLSSLISDFPKNISVPTHPKSDLELLASHLTRGAYHDRHGRGVECGGRGSVLRAMGLQGELKDL